MTKLSPLMQDQLRDEARELLTKLVVSQESGDLSLFASCFDHTDDLVNISTDLDNIWYGWEEFSRHMKNIITERSKYKIEERNTRVSINYEGTTAWFSQLIDTCLETKDDPIRLEGFRHTGVMLRRNGKWLIIQSHISAPIVVEK